MREQLQLEHSTVSLKSEGAKFTDRAELARAQAMKVSPENLRLLPLAQAASDWFKEVKEPALTKSKTIIQYNLYLKNISASEIGSLLVGQLHHGHLLEYQKQRRAAGLCVSYVNHETNLIKQVLDYCDLWENIRKHFRQLPPQPWRPPKVLSPEEEDRFFKVASSHPDWAVACCALHLTNHTSAFGVELRTLQLKHIFLDGEWRFSPKIHVPDETAKNQFRARVVPLNEIALSNVVWIVERARSLGAYLPEHYIFPKRVKRGSYDVTQPASASYIRNAFDKMRKAAGLPWLQARFLRNQIITKLFERGTADETITSITGHHSINMSRYYSQIRFGAKKDAVDALVPQKKKKFG